MGLIQFSTLTFPSNMGTSVADVMARAPLWDAGLDYQHGTSHGIGSFLSVHECKMVTSKCIRENPKFLNFSSHKRPLRKHQLRQIGTGIFPLSW